MPNDRKRLPYRKNRRFHKKRTRLGRPPIGLYPSTYKFKRAITDVIAINTTTTAPDGWSIVDNGLCATFVFALDQLTDKADFTNLFRKYKIDGVKTQLYFTNNQTFSDTNANIRVPQLMMYTNVNQTGRVNIPDTASGHSEQYFLNTQTARKQTVVHDRSRPYTLYHKVKQLSKIYGSEDDSGNKDYSLKNPGYISTSDPTAEHYGFELRLQSVKGGPVPESTNEVPISMKMIHTFYFSCQGVE